VLDAGVVIRRRKRGRPPAALIEGPPSLWAAGGERCADLAPLREASRSGPTTEVNRSDPEGGSGLDLIRWQRGKAWPPGWGTGPNPVPATKRSSTPGAARGDPRPLRPAWPARYEGRMGGRAGTG
jgi:hypothetical protein